MAIIKGIYGFSIEPSQIQRGLAMYHIGNGEPVFLMPYPHASSPTSMAESPLAVILLDLGYSVITFDPPSSFQSSRPATCGMKEMIDCTNETLAFFKIHDSISLVSHSMGGFCAIAFTINYPEKVKSLTVIGSPSGWKAVKKWGVQKSWKWNEKAYWQSRRWGARVILGMDNLKIHKKLDNLITSVSYHQRKYIERTPVLKSDRKKPAPVRAKWLKKVRKYDYFDELEMIIVPTLIIAGKYDRQAPLKMCYELNYGIIGSEMKIFSNSGHFPFIEEQEKFTKIIGQFLQYSSVDKK
nr:alpha/beta hydrolase [Bacteroidota bacterium]